MLPKNIIEDIYEEVFEATSEDIRIKEEDNLVIAETPSADYYDTLYETFLLL